MDQIVSSSIPTLKTERLILRSFSLNDAAEVQRQAGSRQIAATTGTVPHPYLDGMAESWISGHAEKFAKGHGADWALVRQNDEQLVGCISLMRNQANSRAEVGYWVGEEFWGQGYCSEATKAVIRYGFEEWNLNKITSCHMIHNPASGKVMIKAGMIQEGVLRQHLLKDGRFIDIVVYGLLQTEWKR